MSYKFVVGQIVNFTPGSMRSAAAGPYKICRLMPEDGAGKANPRYRIKSVDERHERVVPENDLTPYDELDCLFT